MQTSLLCVAVLLCAATAMAGLAKPYYDLNDAPELFEKFIQDYHRHYVDAADRERHYRAFVKALKQIDAFNTEPGNTAVFDINKFADYTPEEWKQMNGLIPGHKD